MSDIFLRKANQSDCRDIYEWRNNLSSREMSLNSEVIKFEDHKLWFRHIIESSEHFAVICSNNLKEKIGIVRFALDENAGHVSINLNPSKRGKGLSRACLANAIDFFLLHVPKCKKLLAKVKVTNLPSKKIFESCGFTELEIIKDVITYVYELK